MKYNDLRMRPFYEINTLIYQGDCMAFLRNLQSSNALRLRIGGNLWLFIPTRIYPGANLILMVNGLIQNPTRSVVLSLLSLPDIRDGL